MKHIYITTTLPYVNAEPHIGFALEAVHADILARYHILKGDAVFFNTGTDEHGIKIYRKAKERGVSPQKYVDEYAEKFRSLQKTLNLWDGINFVRTTDKHHKNAAQEFWKLCDKNGDIYKKNYKIKYCVGCELEKTDSDLNEKGCCPLHPDQELETIDEENYFFRFSKYQKQLLEFYGKNPQFVIPNFRFNEIKKFIERGLENFSISRRKEKMPWGVPVPGDEEQVMYVWFDALVNYISAIGWPDDLKKFNTWWPVIQFAGKDNIRQQAAMWTAMLFSAGLSPSKQIVIHGFITVGGQKMSKSLGNVIDPVAIVNEYGTDALRYYLARHIHSFEDSDFTMEKFKEAYNANLANGLGNLVSRIMKLAEDNLKNPIESPAPAPFPKEYTDAIESYEFNRAMDFIWSRVQKLDERITTEEPFKLVKKNPMAGKKIIFELAVELYWIGRMLFPFMPEANIKIKETIKENKMPQPLFIRK
ncbi:MAG: methionine--tRNA ligase [Parcubacteria group bacterium]|nr:methionine--tRNA ligase [Parcubacteria group bacterium]